MEKSRKQLVNYFFANMSLNVAKVLVIIILYTKNILFVFCVKLKGSIIVSPKNCYQQGKCHFLAPVFRRLYSLFVDFTDN